jgi:hypothetical protein
VRKDAFLALASWLERQMLEKLTKQMQICLSKLQKLFRTECHFLERCAYLQSSKGLFALTGFLGTEIA